MYTSTRSADLAVKGRRKQPAPPLPAGESLDSMLGRASIVTGSCLTGYLIAHGMCLLPSIALSKLSKCRKVGGTALENRSNADGGSVTAIKMLSARSQAAMLGFGPDTLAPQLMYQLSLFPKGIFGSWSMSRAALALVRLHYYLTRRLYNDQIAFLMRDRMPFGEIAFAQARTCWLDDVCLSFADKHANTPCNLVILGAGYDTRCYRLALHLQVRCFEVDAPGTQAEKKAVLSRARIPMERVKLVSVDFAEESWLEKLEASGFDGKLPTCFVFEGVVYYLPRSVVESTLKLVSKQGKGSVIGFDWFGPWSQSELAKKSTKAASEPWLWCVESDSDLSALVQGAGLSLKENLKHTELIERYLPTHVDGRPLGHLDDFGGFALAGC